MNYRQSKSLSEWEEEIAHIARISPNHPGTDFLDDPSIFRSYCRMQHDGLALDFPGMEHLISVPR